MLKDVIAADEDYVICDLDKSSSVRMQLYQSMNAENLPLPENSGMKKEAITADEIQVVESSNVAETNQPEEVDIRTNILHDPGISLGVQFNSFLEVKESIKEYEKRHFVQLRVGSSKTVIKKGTKVCSNCKPIIRILRI